MTALQRAPMLVGALALALALPAAASAATKTVTMGLPAKSAKTFNERYGTDVNAFFPRVVTIHAGDSVRFVPRGFHNADVPARGGSGQALITPTAEPASGAVDAAGAPFWFNGQPQFGFNPALLQSRFGQRATYTGAERVDSGLPLQDAPKPFVVRFAKAGTYTYECDVHPGMKGVVRVLPKGRSVPSARQDRARVAKQVAATLKVTKALPTEAPAGVVDLGVAGAGGVERLAMVPSTITIAPGTTLRFRMTQGSFEVHNAAFGPGNPEQDPTSYLGVLAASFESPVISPLAFYPSQAPGSPNDVTSTVNGNGFFNTGLLDRSGATPLASEATARFPEPGTFTFYCLVHPFMRGEVVVR